MKSSISILMQQLPDGRMSVDEFVAGDVTLEVAANALRMVADKLDRERILAEVTAEAVPVDAGDDSTD